METEVMDSAEHGATARTMDCDVAVIGAGPAGLMAAEGLAGKGLAVHVFEAKSSAGRKFLMAGKGGLNLTHSEALPAFVSRYGEHSAEVSRWLDLLSPDRLRAWARDLGVETFVGSSGRVFPQDMKAAPLLRAWLVRLRAQGVVLHMRHRWLGWQGGEVLEFQAPEGRLQVRARAVVLALGGGSWARLGSDGQWVPWLEQRGIEVAPLKPANCGFDVGLGTVQAGAGIDRREFMAELLGASRQPVRGWSPYFCERFAGQPFKSVALSFDDGQGGAFSRKGEFVATATGVEGSLVYAVSAALREAIARDGQATIHIDLLPQRTPEDVLAQVRHPRGSRSLASHLKGRLGLEGIKAAVLHEVLGKEGMADAARLAHAIKALPLTLVAPRPIDEAISTAGGVRLQALDARGMCVAAPGVFCAGEMLDWEAPTGGYLLTACMASGVQAAQGVERYLEVDGQVD
ncbi:dihydropyrimidine dehydrogenase subunit A [Delftia tsuruhatensis]|uniref:TIGR03862 family flavoprotein n=1 Tax=Delftia tsuruhatensis TaxID=180282 RepID=UPI001E72EB12|nr:TIGR03862 family flavoprotein [Delftia tsuruhatensis]CAB5662101.1 dihydropyrimidine dehydrogenase subunit A [Delftia tsuruhatensis]CAC9680243.1 dihydropyrimidine dehydrogenase subunit A [Delftia tsuruhatensis]